MQKNFKKLVVTIDVTSKKIYTIVVIVIVTSKEVNVMTLFSKLFNKNLKEETNMTQIEKALELINVDPVSRTLNKKALKND